MFGMSAESRPKINNNDRKLADFIASSKTLSEEFRGIALDLIENSNDPEVRRALVKAKIKDIRDEALKYEIKRAQEAKSTSASNGGSPRLLRI